MNDEPADALDRLTRATLQALPSPEPSVALLERLQAAVRGTKSLPVFVRLETFYEERRHGETRVLQRSERIALSPSSRDAATRPLIEERLVTVTYA